MKQFFFSYCRLVQDNYQVLGLLILLGCIIAPAFSTFGQEVAGLAVGSLLLSVILLVVGFMVKVEPLLNDAEYLLAQRDALKGDFCAVGALHGEPSRIRAWRNNQHSR